MKLYNTLTRQLEDFKPIHDKQVSLYTCGLTVYSHPLIGNWVAYIYWDVLVRTLRAAGYQVNRVQNITDVGHLTSDEDAGEDKMLKGALKEGLTAWQVADKYIKIADHEAYELLGLLRPDHMPRATDYIEQQIAFVKTLEQKGFTYQLPDGLYFDTSKLDDYGKLARLDIDGLRFGARVQDTGKKNPTDFAVWKLSSPDEKRDMEWDSPWGKGFPGWHLECSVMARELLGDTIDIHTGGIDHIPVHHTNEIAQTEAVTGQPFAHYWLHNNHIKVNGTKISKSLGNGFTLPDLIDKGFSPVAFKLLVLSKHYRTEGNFTWEILEAAQNRLQRWQAAADMRWQIQEQASGDDEHRAKLLNAQQALELALFDDLDTPGALASAEEGFGLLEQGIPVDVESAAITFLETVRDRLGIDLLASTDITDSQKQMIKQRETARRAGNWEAADRLRQELLADGLKLHDTNSSCVWARL